MKKKKQAVAAKDNPIYQLADRLTNEQIELECLAAVGMYADVCRKALGRRTKRALTVTPYGAKLMIAEKILRRKGR